ncbi:YbaB/EbfC family nucleoid-associated protein [Actinoplanes derwentensis]|uniref:Conserved DNA-binding protein YbaB n=1 Tax=Actinoplanes derwentensis TaxID=113562 RepID=A0A1H1Z9N4_9ACTN|nr:YbaB/EbfC family nucleoid-associated protein [Actinoplanes derwentensis]GID82325.1 hypothetical protein Ade03nite_12490 [Actinoplanes derwentensis]SDT30398.1 Conserved DNA-binding protein YbaB [Actinoplanes derwentensis]
MSRQADRDANHALRARFDDVVSQYQRLRLGLDDLQERLSAMTVTAESPDRMVKATVGPRGQLVDLKFDPEAYRRLTPEQLSRTVLRTVEQAVAQTTDQVQEIVGEYLPADSGASRFMRDGQFSSFLARQDRVMREAGDDDGR